MTYHAMVPDRTYRERRLCARPFHVSGLFPLEVTNVFPVVLAESRHMHMEPLPLLYLLEQIGTEWERGASLLIEAAIVVKRSF